MNVDIKAEYGDITKAVVTMDGEGATLVREQLLSLPEDLLKARPALLGLSRALEPPRYTGKPRPTS